MDNEKLCTTNGQTVEEVRAAQAADPTGQHAGYIVLCEEERQKGYVRPYRDRYKHVGIRPKYPLADLTPEQKELFGDVYSKYEAFPPDSPESMGGLRVGRYWSEEDLCTGCGAVTDMGRSLSETYAVNPKFYGSTFCTLCNAHYPVEEFVWTVDGKVVGS